MALIVQKYGGTSVADPKRIKVVAERVVRTIRENNQVIVVVSALGGTTDDLLDLASQVTKNPNEREMDMLLSTGEQISVSLLAMALHDLGYPAISFTGSQIGILTDSTHTKARIKEINGNRLHDELNKGKVVVVAGFQGVDMENNITTLGRGGSDTTAVALASIVKADVCEIYTDVDGIYTADPHIIKEARKLARISHDEMLELASLGAKIMNARAVEFAKKYDVTIHVRSSFNDNLGTLITKEEESMEEPVIRGVTMNTEESKITILHVPDTPGVAAKIFKILAEANINIDMIIQNVSEKGKTDISFTVMKSDFAKAVKILNAVSQEVGGGGIVSDEKIAKVSIVGVGMKSHSGVAALMFEALAEEEINIEMISTSEIKISCVIRKSDAKKAVKALHSKFNLEKVLIPE